MECNSEIEKVRNEVLRKLGRNLLIFQHIETSLKFIVANSNVSGYLSEIMDVRTHQQEVYRKKMMGQLIDPFLAELYGAVREFKEGSEREEIGVSFSFRCEVDASADVVEKRRASLEMVIRERNELVHHFFQRVQQNSKECWLDAEVYLDDQRGRVLPELSYLQSYIRTYGEVQELYQRFLESDQWEKLLEDAFEG
jgi:uncharacterized protein YicC (UPF0701 family)